MNGHLFTIPMPIREGSCLWPLKYFLTGSSRFLRDTLYFCATKDIFRDPEATGEERAAQEAKAARQQHLVPDLWRARSLGSVQNVPGALPREPQRSVLEEEPGHDVEIQNGVAHVVCQSPGQDSVWQGAWGGMCGVGWIEIICCVMAPAQFLFA